MKKVMTVCGPIEPEQLGFTSMHEHILSDCSMFRNRVRKACVFPGRSDRRWQEKLQMENRSDHRHDIVLSLDNMKLDDEQSMTFEVTDFKNSGGDSIVEVSAPGIRSTPADLKSIRRIAERTGVHIVVSTGLYVEDTWPDRFRFMTFEQYVEFLRQEIEHGIANTGILPGHIKAAYETPSQQLAAYLRAAATVSSETGISLQVHLGPDVTPDEVRKNVLKPLLQGGAEPGKTVLCHVQFLIGVLAIKKLVTNPGRVPFDINFLRELAEQGFMLCFTPFGFEADNEILGIAHYPDWYSLSGILALIQEGYIEQLVIGNDVFTKLATRRGGGEGYRRLIDFVVPALQMCDVSAQDIRKIMFENPARILAYSI